MTTQEKIKHLYDRAGFGASLSIWNSDRSLDDVLLQLIRASEPEPLEVVTRDDWKTSNGKALKAMEISDEERKMRQKDFRSRNVDLNLAWIRQMVQSSNPLQEKMAFFWHGHFAARIDNPYFDQLLLQDIRKNALGSFGDLLAAVSKSPSMLQFLNNQQNKKQHPNENFAREVMELFTLGRGHYSETDIKEAARAFTGWSYDEDGQFVFRAKQHDDDPKTILGQTGAFNGDDVLRILLEQKQTALFITQKLYRFFVNEEVVDPRHVQQLADIFYNTKYSIGALMQAIFSSDWFYAPQQMGTKIKSPVELLVGIQRIIPMVYKNDKTIINLQRILGQQLFYPPNVAGWPGGKNWIDSSSLVIRMKLPEAFFASKELHLEAKEALDSQMTDETKKKLAKAAQGDRFKVGQVQADWTGYIDFWKKYEPAQLPRLLADFLLPVKINDEQLAEVRRFTDESTTQTRIQSLTIRLMGLPEYQLC